MKRPARAADLQLAKAIIAQLLKQLEGGAGADSPEYSYGYTLVAQFMPSALHEHHIQPREE